MSIDLPAVPATIIEHNGDFWVTGWDEFIAVSHDRGRTWTAKHLNQGGEIIFGISWTTDRVGYVTGSGGLLAKTTDGGDRWYSQKADTRIGNTDVLFSPDGLHGALASTDLFQFTSDGGHHWSTHKGHGKLHLASLGPDRWVATSGSISPNEADGINWGGLPPAHGEVATTIDARHWHTQKLRDIRPLALITANNIYQLYGETTNGTPALMESADGLTWKPAPKPATYFMNCSPGGGCFNSDSVWLPRPDQPQIRMRPPKLPLWPLHLAVSGEVACAVTTTLMCATMKPDTLPLRASAVSWSANVVPPKPTFSPDPPYPVEEKTKRPTGKVYIFCEIDALGAVDADPVTAATSAAFARAALAAVAQWRFKPATRDGKAIPVSAEVEMNFRIF